MKRSTPVEPRAEFRLADESPVTIRPVEPTDKPLLAGAFAELSEESRGSGRELHFDVALPARAGAGPTLRDLLRAAAAGFLAPARAFHGKAPDDA